MTDLGIANLAFIELGQPALATEDDQSKAGRLYRAMYEPTVREVLRSHPWRCARRIVVLSADPDNEPDFGFDHACPLPADFVKVVKVNDNIDKFQIIGRFLQVDDDAPELTYIARVPASELDDSVVSVIAARLAWRWCITLTDSANAAQGYMKNYDLIAADAKFADATDGAPEEEPLGVWEQARLSEA